MKAIQLISQDLFDKVRSRFQNLEMGDEIGAVTIDPAEARFFDFDFINEGVNLGRVSISLNDAGSLKVYYSQGITENQDDLARKMWYNFLKEMRLFSMRRLLRFDTRDIAKTHLDKNDFQHLAATQGPKEDPEMNNMNETKKIKKGVAENAGRELTNTPRDNLISRMSPSVDNNALLQKVGKVVHNPEFDSDRILKIVDAGDSITHPVGRYIQKEFDELQYDLGREYEDYPERVAEKLLSMLQDRTHQYMAEGSAHGYNVVRYYEKTSDQLKLTNWLRKQAGLPKDAPVYFDDADLVYGDKTIVPGALVNPKLKFNDLLTALTQATGGQGKQNMDGVYREQGLQESRWNHKSSSKTSRAVQGKTEVIVRHANKVAETYPGARSQRQNIKAIFIQNHEGERFKYPFIHTAGAFAMAQHIDHGGVPHDPAGKAIIKMSENIAQLGEFQRHIQRSALHDDAHGIVERAIGHMHELKARVAAIGKRHHYQAWKEDFDNSGMEPPTEDEMVLDAVTLEDYKNKFTQTNFQEELVGFFPLLHSIMREANTVDLEEYVNESNEETEEGHNPNSAGVRFEQFEEWAESTEQGTLTPDQLNNLKAAIEALPQGDQGPELDVTAADAFFSNPDLGLIELPNFDEFEQSLHDEQGRSEEIQATPIQLFQSWAKENNPALLSALGMEGGEAAAPAPEAAPEAPEAPPVAPPVAPEQPVAEGSKGSMVQEVAKIVKSFYNASNESVGPFRGEEGIVIDVEKQISEKFGEKEGKQAGEMARAFMEKLTQQWHRKHGKVANGHQDDGLARMMELVGNIKQKVEGMGQPEMEKEGMMDKAKAFGKKVLDKVAPDDDELLRRLQKDSGVPAHAQHGKPPMATPNRRQQQQENAELETILRLSDFKK